MQWYHPLVRPLSQRMNLQLNAALGVLRKSAPPILLAVIFLFAIFELSTSARPRPRSTLHASLQDHYLMLVNTAMSRQMDSQKLTQFDRSPYDGLAVSFSDAYDVLPTATIESMEKDLAGWKKFTGKQIWPWVYLNRMVGADNVDGNELTKVPYFQKFQGLDLDGKAGAQRDFLQNWDNALRAAQKRGAPGIVFDLEFYNNYKADDVAKLAQMTSMSKPEVLEALKKLGSQMADSAASEDPGAMIWILFTGFARPDYRIIDQQPYFLAGTYIVEGLLDRIQERRLPLHVLSGGELGLGYCHASVEDLRQAIEKRAAVFAPILHKYNGILELGGTMTLWSDASAKKNWVSRGSCGSSAATTVENLVPYMELLFRSYRYNWIYASPNGGYLAFNPEVAPRFDAAIAKAKHEAYGY